MKEPIFPVFFFVSRAWVQPLSGALEGFAGLPPSNFPRVRDTWAESDDPEGIRSSIWSVLSQA